MPGILSKLKPSRAAMPAIGFAVAATSLVLLYRRWKNVAKLLKESEEGSEAYPDYDGSETCYCRADSEAPVRLAKSGIASLPPETVRVSQSSSQTSLIARCKLFRKVPAVFARAVSFGGNAPALRVERGGKWIQWTWAEYGAEASASARALVSLGVQPFGSVAIVGFNSPEWFLAFMGALLCGAKAAGIYTTNSPAACAYTVRFEVSFLKSFFF